MKNLPQRLLAEWLGTAALLAIVVGSGHMGETLSPDNLAIALLANSIATGLGLWVLIEVLGGISGAHFNPIVTAAIAWRKELTPGVAVMYVGAQIAGALCGVFLAHAMFGLDIFQTGIKPRTGVGQLLSEGVATAGLLLTIFVGRVSRPSLVPAMVGAYIACAYWFTASTSFANPAVTIARSLTSSFAGIRPEDVPLFIAAQVTGAFAGYVLSVVLVRAYR